MTGALKKGFFNIITKIFMFVKSNICAEVAYDFGIQNRTNREFKHIEKNRI